MRQLQLITGLLVGLRLITGSLAEAGQAGLHQEGQFWVETTSGSEVIGDSEQVKIVCLGNVTIRGVSKGEIGYSVARKVRARSQAQARDMLQEAGVSLVHQGRFVRLVVNDAAGPVELRVTVPRGVHTLLAGTDAGNVDIADLDGSATAQTGGGNIRMSRVRGNVELNSAGGTLNLDEIGGWARAVNSAGDIVAGAIGGEARMETAGGDITVQRAGGPIRANTAGGKVRIGQAGGLVIASTAGGAIEIGNVTGGVTARNAGGGPILVGSATGSVQCDNASGGIKVGSAGGTVRLTTASGSVVAQLQGGKLLGDSLVATESGDITVYIPSNMGVMIRAHNEGASRAEAIISDFPGLQVRLDGGVAEARGAINGGGPVLRIDGTGGMIWIKRK